MFISQGNTAHAHTSCNYTVGNPHAEEKKKKVPTTTVTRWLRRTPTLFFLCYSLLIAHVDSANAYLTSKNVILMMVEGAGFLQVVVMETAAAA